VPTKHKMKENNPLIFTSENIKKVPWVYEYLNPALNKVFEMNQD